MKALEKARHDVDCDNVSSSTSSTSKTNLRSRWTCFRPPPTPAFATCTRSILHALARATST
eukprot:7376820-Prymnesium_polylepis.1